MRSLRLLAVLVPITAALVAPAAAHAERVVTEDAVSDAQTIRSDAEEEVFTPAPEHAAADITRTVVMHGEQRIQVRVHLRDLERTLPSAAYVKVRTPARRFDIATSHNTPDAGIELTRGSREDSVTCHGLRSSLDDARDLLTVSVPSACLDDPAWVQVGVLAVAADVDVSSELDEPYDVYFDDAHKTGGFEDHGVRVGPKVYAG